MITLIAQPARELSEVLHEFGFFHRLLGHDAWPPATRTRSPGCGPVAEPAALIGAGERNGFPTATEQFPSVMTSSGWTPAVRSRSMKVLPMP